MSLEAAFLEHLPAHGEAYRGLSGLDELLSALVGRARVAWSEPKLEFSSEGLVAHLAERLPPSKAALKTLQSVAIEDLCLAFCLAEGNPRALPALESLLTSVARSVASLDTSGVLADDVKAVLREKLLVPRENGKPRIADYAGQGALRAWLKAAAIRHALNLKRPGHREAADEQEQLASMPMAAPNPELALIRKKHKQHFALAFAAAMASLTPRERTLLKLHTLDGLPLDQIAPLYQKDKSTISRWIARAQQQLHEVTRAQLVAALNLSSGELESVLRAAQSELSMSLSRLLDD